MKIRTCFREYLVKDDQNGGYYEIKQLYDLVNYDFR